MRLSPNLLPSPVSFLPQHDLGALLGVSKPVRAAVLPAVHTFTLFCDGPTRDVQALCRLLGGMPSLQRLVTPIHSNSQEVIRTVTTNVLHNVQLPLLTELLLYDVWADGGLCLAEALEMRHGAHLTPMTHLATAIEGEDVARRIWDCCPRDKVTHLHAYGEGQLLALAAYLASSTSSPALQFLQLDGTAWPHRHMASYPDVVLQPLARILELLERGVVPCLTELQLSAWDLGPTYLVPLGAALARGKLSKLSSLEIDQIDLWTDDEGSGALLGGLQSHGKLQRFHLTARNFSNSYNLTTMVSRLTPGGAFGLVEELKLDWGSRDAPVRTKAGLAQGLSTLLAQGQPCSLRILHLNHSKLDISWLDLLAPVFAAGVFCNLKTLEIRGHGNAADAGFPETWRIAGSLIKLQVLTLDVPMPTAVEPRFLAALQDLGFCPFLLHAFYCPSPWIGAVLERADLTTRQQNQGAQG